MNMETYIMPAIAVFCCAMGLAFKAAFPQWDRAHDFIPLGCAAVGAVLACWAMGATLDSLAAGAVSGIAATGIWEQAVHALPGKGE